ncbi:hypothetical protein HELRODRAFT_81872 [Helobdella robusta]|uniref:non-specific serine/threonine protein kinase n=1 Tax=Helobdella robusta TaxID=6412 RepID=T1G4K0_HELRO|nr:hypothetical protein HELRODRAFT_81872 [Helobdella robusta]ESO01219.1 hypothetical protein HELRODRAFT_81872 [Helobdella robusta]
MAFIITVAIVKIVITIITTVTIVITIIITFVLTTIIIITQTTKSWPHSKKVGSYLIGSTLGQGAFAKVKMGLHVYTAKKVAVKIIDKKTCIENSYASKNMKREAKIWKKIDHRNVVKLLDVLETNNGYYLITELCGGSDLKSVISSRICGCLDESESSVYLYDILSAVSYMHGLGIIHRDLKIDNILLDGRGNVKLIDFGLSCFDSSQSHCRTFCGSPAYAAPELLANQSYGKKVDVWSIGVNMYVMLTGNLPFTVHPFSVNSIYEKMTNQGMNVIEISISSGQWDLLLKLLAVDPDRRVTADEALQHDWFSKISRKSRELFLFCCGDLDLCSFYSLLI